MINGMGAVCRIILFPACLAMATGQDLTPRLEDWRREIEKAGNAQVAVGRVEWDRKENTLSLARETPLRDLFVEYLKNESFARAFVSTHAVLVTRRSEDGSARYLIFVNLGRRDEWAGHEEALLAHELAHASIRMRGFPTPFYQEGPPGCPSIHAGNILQHILMRKELRNRGIDHAAYQRASLERGAPVEGTVPGGHRGCTLVAAVAERIDVELGLRDTGWPGLAAYEANARRQWPEAESEAREIMAYLREKDLDHLQTHREALVWVFERLRDLWYRAGGASPQP